MQREYHRWFSPRLNREMGIVVFGHFGPPMLTFPTSGGDEWEYENQSLVNSLGDFIDGGRVKIFSVNGLSGDGFYNKAAHPLHRSWMQHQYGEYVRQEVVPFIHNHCRTDAIPISTMGASLGAYYAAHLLFRYPDVIKRCFALSGVYDMRSFMNGVYDDHFYFNNPVDYLPNLSDPWYFRHLAACDIHIATGHGPWENSGPSYRLSSILSQKGIPHHLDDWGPLGGHDWMYWKHQMREYIGGLF
jgi:esterase/lipase superfamily enzyme